MVRARQGFEAGRTAAMPEMRHTSLALRAAVDLETGVDGARSARESLAALGEPLPTGIREMLDVLDVLAAIARS